MKTPYHRNTAVRFSWSILFILGFSASPLRAQTNAADTSALTYSRDIQSILLKSCLNCHGGDEDPKAGLYVDYYDDLMHGGKHGSPVVPGKPDSSFLYLKVTENPPFGKRMPRKGNMLSAEQIEKIRLWILQGALKDHSQPAAKK